MRQKTKTLFVLLCLSTLFVFSLLLQLAIFDPGGIKKIDHEDYKTK